MEQQIQIKGDDQTMKGVYCNLAAINHAKEEFSIDFINLTQGGGFLLSRVFMSPGHAKRLLMALQSNIEIYEKQFKKIEEAAEPEKKIGFTK